MLAVFLGGVVVGYQQFPELRTRLKPVRHAVRPHQLFQPNPRPFVECYDLVAVVVGQQEPPLYPQQAIRQPLMIFPAKHHILIIILGAPVRRVAVEQAVLPVVLADHLLLECRIAVRRFVGGAVGHVGVLSLVARQLLHLMRHHLAVISGVDGAEGDDVARLHLHPAVGLGDHHVARGKFVLHGIGPHDGKLIAEQPLTLDLVEGGDGNDRKQRRQDGDQRDQHRENPAGDGQGSARGKQRCGLCSLVVVHVAYQTFPGDTASTMLSTPATLSHGMSLWFIIERFSPFVNEGGTGFISAGATR